MNTVQTFLDENWQRLGLDSTGIPRQLASLVLTPRFEASRHVIFLLMPEHGAQPVLVAKIPRLPRETASLRKEADVLRSVQGLRAGGFDSVPKLIAFETHRGFPLLVETAITGSPVSPRIVRRSPVRCCNVVSGWLVDIHLASHRAANAGSFDKSVATPLDQFARGFPMSEEERTLMRRTEKIVGSLHNAPVPLVVEHGDLGHPNLFFRPDGTLGVVDWELARLDGVPACDLYFFLTYAAFAVGGTSSERALLKAFRGAFFGPEAWARRHIEAFADRTSLPRAVLTALFVLCWARYVSGLWLRVRAGQESAGRDDAEAAAWLRSNRYFALWRYAVDNVARLHWQEGN